MDAPDLNKLREQVAARRTGAAAARSYGGAGAAPRPPSASAVHGPTWLERRRDTIVGSAATIGAIIGLAAGATNGILGALLGIIVGMFVAVIICGIALSILNWLIRHWGISLFLIGAVILLRACAG